MSKVAEIKEALEKAEKQLETAKKMNAPQAAIDTANNKIKKLKEDLEEAEKTPPSDEKKEEVKKTVKEKKAPKAKAAKKAKAPKKVKPAKGKRGRKKMSKEEKTLKRKQKAASKVEKTVTINGKTYTEKDKEFCDKLLQKWHGRKVAMKKANKKFKTKSISSRISGDMADDVLKTFKFVQVDQKDKIIDNPSSYVAKFDRIIRDFKRAAESLKSVLGDNYKSSQFKSAFDTIEREISKEISKLKKQKK